MAVLLAPFDHQGAAIQQQFDLAARQAAPDGRHGGGAGPVPQARVTPTPRSHTRMRIRLRSSTWANSTLVRLGKKGRVSILGPSTVTGAFSASGTNRTQWGLPIETALTGTPVPPISR